MFQTLFEILFFVSLAGECLSVQTWQEGPQYTEVNPGDSAILACKIYNKRGSCSWQKDGKPQGMFTGKIEWSGDQQIGDCSLRVLDASEIDDGMWECQVTASSFEAHDALTSGEARLVVRVSPDPPKLEVGSSHVTSHHNFTVREETPSTIKCVSRYGNPPARIKWFLGSEELPTSSYNQSNTTELDRPNTWMSMSSLHARFIKADHGRLLRCVAVHEAYTAKSKDVSVTLDVQYSPTVTLQGAPTADIEEGHDRVALQCLSDANPPASVVWKRLGENDVFSFKQTVEFKPANREHSGTYVCKATNAVGVSNPLSVRLDVKYPPKVTEIRPNSMMTATLNSHVEMNCQAVGDPKPTYEWLQVSSTGRKIHRGNNITLVIPNITYEHQGQYFCRASNEIKGQKKEALSVPIALEVTGAPQVLRYSVQQQVDVLIGDDALLEMSFCSDPQPLITTWEWGSLRLEAGNGKGRYVAERLSQDSGSKDCYQARLRVQHADMNDARNYYLNVQNDQGADRYAVALRVKEPVSMSAVIGIVITCLVMMVVVTLIVFYAFKTEKCCFSHAGDFKSADIDKKKSVDVERQKPSNGRPVDDAPVESRKRPPFDINGSNGNTNGSINPVHLSNEPTIIKEHQQPFHEQYFRQPESVQSFHPPTQKTAPIHHKVPDAQR